MSGDGFVTAFAPASIGNVAVGFDMLGLALQGVGDRVSVRQRPAAGVKITGVLDPEGQPHRNLSIDPEQNTAAIAAAALWRVAGAPGGLEMIVQKGIPLQSGMGSSAASAVAAVVAANALLQNPLEPDELLKCALEGEKYASGSVHADNVAPSLFGGLVFCPPVLLPVSVKLAAPSGIDSVLVHPHLEVNTATARRALAASCSMSQWLEQQAYLASFVLGCERNDTALISRALHDVIIEPQRAALVPFFHEVKGAAMNARALGCSLSGSGPSLFALAESKNARSVASAMEEACRASGVECESWISSMDSPGAHLQAAP
ncbi:MAG: homoserine kinase [Woeseia sp.]